ncbi:MAG: type II secretion system GspH family protein [Helicobacteraceae bacterium]|jgi:prepilin-type N-terminal cleavage/methylation domain-containing protein|nr:type II secretion system GspH family protein [Helicobacteraceae bacterium]
MREKERFARGFTLLEVVIATLIASIAAIAVLNIGLQSSKLPDQIKKREALSAPLSIAALHGKKDFHNTERTLESMLGGAYVIDHDGLKSYLRERSVLYAEEIVDRYEIVAEGYEIAQMPSFGIIARTVGASGLEGRIYAIERE